MSKVAGSPSRLTDGPEFRRVVESGVVHHLGLPKRLDHRVLGHGRGRLSGVTRGVEVDRDLGAQKRTPNRNRNNNVRRSERINEFTMVLL